MNVTYDNYLGQLVGGDIDFGSVMGKVVICQDGVYGSVCDVNWDQNDANVFCNSIGFGGKSLYISYSHVMVLELGR